MIIVNLYGAPGTGKSTGAAYIFSKLKMAGINSELITEYAKDKTWENNMTALSNQVYVFGKQYYRVTTKINQVDVIVTDSPLLLSIIYNEDNQIKKTFDLLCYQISEKFDNVNYYLRRVKKYNPAGRTQSESESDLIATQIKDLLDNYKQNYTVYDANQKSYDIIVDDVLKIINEKKRGK